MLQTQAQRRLAPPQAGAVPMGIFFLVGCLWVGCGPKPHPSITPPLEQATEPSPLPTRVSVPWATTTQTAPSRTPGVLCEHHDARLDAAANTLAARPATETPVTPEDFIFALRRAGSPYVWPQMMSVVTSPASPAEATAHAKEWVRQLPASSETRCGLFTAVTDEGARTVAIALSPLADLAPLPTRVHVGRWLVVRGQLRRGVSDPQVVVAGPRGLPKLLATGRGGNGAFRATFAADTPGRWDVQVMGSGETGPRPVLGAYVYAGVAPETAPLSTSVPGEAWLEGQPSDAEALAAAIQGARKASGVAPLKRNRDLDFLASQHAAAMLRQTRIGHDLGAGSASERLRAAGFSHEKLGENVAQAKSARMAHRALWASPSHRKNLLDPAFDSFGVGIAKGADETLWVSELFTRAGP